MDSMQSRPALPPFALMFIMSVLFVQSASVTISPNHPQIIFEQNKTDDYFLNSFALPVQQKNKKRNKTLRGKEEENQQSLKTSKFT